MAQINYIIGFVSIAVAAALMPATSTLVEEEMLHTTLLDKTLLKSAATLRSVATLLDLNESFARCAPRNIAYDTHAGVSAGKVDVPHDCAVKCNSMTDKIDQRNCTRYQFNRKTSECRLYGGSEPAKLDTKRKDFRYFLSGTPCTLENAMKDYDDEHTRFMVQNQGNKAKASVQLSQSKRNLVALKSSVQTEEGEITRLQAALDDLKTKSAEYDTQLGDASASLKRRKDLQQQLDQVYAKNRRNLLISLVFLAIGLCAGVAVVLKIFEFSPKEREAITYRLGLTDF